MMDSSFSMVTMQGEDSGIAWETSPSRCTSPWVSEVGNPTMNTGSPVVVQPATMGSVPAGKVIFVMDEEMISRRKRSKPGKQKEVLAQSSEDILGRPELVEVSQPNIKTKEEDEEALNDPLDDKDQRLFSVVSEGSEILNIVVPTNLATVDEEESREMVDNLSYLEESPVPKASEETHDYQSVISTMESSAEFSHHIRCSPSCVMDPPGAPVARPPGRETAGNVDYFEAFNLIDCHGPGGLAAVAQKMVEQEAELTMESQDIGKRVHKSTTITDLNKDESDTNSLGEITSELLDEVFYSGTDNYLKNQKREGELAGGATVKLPSKQSGSSLFGSQEDILTPIFLPEGPPKIIDPILLEEPKAMAFLYTDLYEEAIGCRKREEDTESMTSEKSFHSRTSDREDRGYLEKYVLVDETPAVEVEPTDEGNSPEEGLWVLPQDLYDLGKMQSKLKKDTMPNSDEEITDFFRFSANSSPCYIEPCVQLLDTEEAQPSTMTVDKRKEIVSIKAEQVAEMPTDPLSISSFEFTPEEFDWESTYDPLVVLDEKNWQTSQDLCKDLQVEKPVAPPRKKISSPKTCLDLTPLTPIDSKEKGEKASGKEQTEEEEDTATPAGMADKGDGDGEDTVQTCNFTVSESVLAAVELPQTESLRDSNYMSDTNSAATKRKDTKTVEQEETCETGASQKQNEPQEVDTESSEYAIIMDYPEKQHHPTGSPPKPAKNSGQCIIL